MELTGHGPDRDLSSLLSPFLQRPSEKEVWGRGGGRKPIIIVYLYILLYIHYFPTFFHFFHRERSPCPLPNGERTGVKEGKK
jgi:hypothetical protein